MLEQEMSTLAYFLQGKAGVNKKPDPIPLHFCETSSQKNENVAAAEAARGSRAPGGPTIIILKNK